MNQIVPNIPISPTNCRIKIVVNQIITSQTLNSSQTFGQHQKDGLSGLA